MLVTEFQSIPYNPAASICIITIISQASIEYQAFAKKRRNAHKNDNHYLLKIKRGTISTATSPLIIENATYDNIIAIF